MTVSSLWTALDEAGCGSPVSINDFDLRGRARGGGNQEEKQTILAVDLSIWICEGISSTVLSTFHSDPALHLVYQRTTKLLKLGLGLVFVVEGQRRVFVPTTTTSSSSSSAFQQTHELKSRRSGSQFWDASKRCESMLQSLGVPVVRAEAEGEALCALLNSSGLVDGVISNDGDCLLFGAKTVYTNFSLESLENGHVMRYDASKLVFAERNGGDHSTARTIKLSREDLIAFGMICGSDMCGGGIPHCGHKKAIQFIHACRSVKGQQCHGTTCLDELLSWSDIVAATAGGSSDSNDAYLDCDDDGPCTVPLRCCSICLHAGDKLQHEKHGCAECGTGPGEGCCLVSYNEKFLRSMKAKTLRGPIASRHIVDQYMSPNSNHVPSSLRLLLSKPYVVSPDPRSFFTTSMILKGRTKESSHEYVKSTLPKLLARLDLWDTRPRNNYVTSTSKLKYKPIPLRIEKCVVKQSWLCYELIWSINIGVVEDEQFQFNTFECQSVVDAVLSHLVKTFHQEERRKVQGRAEEERRKHFTGAKSRKNHASNRNVQLLQNQRRGASTNPQARQQRRKRDRNFDVSRISKMPKITAPPTSAFGLDVSLLIDSLPDESMDSDIESMSFDEKENHLPLQYDGMREAGAAYCVNTKMPTDCARSGTVANGPSWSSCDYRFSSDEDLHAILFNNIDQDDTVALGYEDIMSTKTLHQHPLPKSSWDDNRTKCSGYDDVYLPSRCEHSHTFKDRVFWDMGIRIEMTPIISRRWRPSRVDCMLV